MKLVARVLAMAAFIAVVFVHSQAHAGTCGPNTIVPEEIIPNFGVYERGCQLHDDCLDGKLMCPTTVGECAAIRDQAWRNSCDYTFADNVLLDWLCNLGASDMSEASDFLTCSMNYGCVGWAVIGCPAPSCTPTTSCEAQNNECGQIHDGCNIVTCGPGCPDGFSCNASHRCTYSGCQPTTSCADLGSGGCGQIWNGCQWVDCGGCGPGDECKLNRCECAGGVLQPSCGWYDGACNTGRQCAGDCPETPCYDDCTGQNTCAPTSCGDNDHNCTDDCTGEWTCYACGDGNGDCYDDCSWDYVCSEIVDPHDCHNRSEWCPRCYDYWRECSRVGRCW